MLEHIEEANILIFVSDPKLKEYMKSILQGEGYIIHECKDAQRLTDELGDKMIDLIILDFNDAGTIEICKTVRGHFMSRHIPIILLVNQGDTIQKIKGIYAGADDYIEKPLEAGELLPRTKANLWRAKRDLDANPLTRLPGNVTILKELERRIKDTEKFCVGYADLSRFKEYNDYYGFEWGDNVIKHTAKLISTIMRELGSPTDFLGHIGGDDFIFITDLEAIKDICSRIIQDFDATVSSFYKEDDLKKGYIIVKNRQGKIIASPLLNISIGVTTNKFSPFQHVGEIIQIATELKNYAKTLSKSIYVIDRRKT